MTRRSKTFFLTIGFIVPILILEVVFRKFSLEKLRGLIREKSGETLSECLITDQNLDHRLLPDCEGKVKTLDFETRIKTNSLGFRDKELVQKWPEVLRVAIIGDSFVEGWGVELEDRFDQIDLDNLDIVNMGVRSYSPYLEQKLLEKYIDEVEPDLVIQFLDFSDLHDDLYYSQKRPTGIIEVVYNLLATKYFNALKVINKVNLTNDIALFGFASDWDGYDQAWDLTRSNLAKTKKFLSDKNIDHKIVVVPRGIHVGSEEWSEGREIIGLEKNILYQIPSIFSISDIDLLSVLKKAEEQHPGKLYFPFDGHWTPLGHKVVKQAVEEYLGKYQNAIKRSE